MPYQDNVKGAVMSGKKLTYGSNPLSMGGIYSVILVVAFLRRFFDVKSPV